MFQRGNGENVASVHGRKRSSDVVQKVAQRELTGDYVRLEDMTGKYRVEFQEYPLVRMNVKREGKLVSGFPSLHFPCGPSCYLRKHPNCGPISARPGQFACGDRACANVTTCLSGPEAVQHRRHSKRAPSSGDQKVTRTAESKRRCTHTVPLAPVSAGQREAVHAAPTMSRQGKRAHSSSDAADAKKALPKLLHGESATAGLAATPRAPSIRPHAGNVGYCECCELRYSSACAILCLHDSTH